MVRYQAYGAGEPAVVLLPTWEIADSRVWKFQLPYLARHGRVVTFDRRVGAYDRRVTAEDALAVMDAAGIARAVVVSWCLAGEDLLLANEHRDRVAGLVLIAPDLELSPDPTAGWAEWDHDFWRRDWRGFVDFFFSTAFSEPHSTKHLEDAIGWGMDADPEAVIEGLGAEWPNARESALALCADVRCPTLVVQGTEDAIVGPARGPAVAEAIPGARLVTLAGCGHAPHLRHPVFMNLLIRDFVRACLAYTIV